jgi:hypothetical protein
MDIFQFMNSKVLFKDVRNRPQDQQPPTPVMVHISESRAQKGWRRGLMSWARSDAGAD